MGVTLDDLETGLLVENGLLNTGTVLPEITIGGKVIRATMDVGAIIDHERVFVPAGSITAEELAEDLRAEHTAEKYPGYTVIFQVVKDRVEVLIHEITDGDRH